MTPIAGARDIQINIVDSCKSTCCKPEPETSLPTTPHSSVDPENPPTADGRTSADMPKEEIEAVEGAEGEECSCTIV